jgi:hypothetical protein
MTIGVRGTVVDINARGADSSVVFLDGSGPVCDETGSNCIVARDDCALYVVPVSGEIAPATGQERQQRLSAFFPFISGQAMLDPAFRIDTSGCEVVENRLLGPPTQDGSDKTSGVVPYQ